MPCPTRRATHVRPCTSILPPCDTRQQGCLSTERDPTGCLVTAAPGAHSRHLPPHDNKAHPRTLSGWAGAFGSVGFGVHRAAYSRLRQRSRRARDEGLWSRRHCSAVAPPAQTAATRDSAAADPGKSRCTGPRRRRSAAAGVMRRSCLETIHWYMAAAFHFLLLHRKSRMTPATTFILGTICI